MHQHNIIKERIAEIQSQLPADKAWWEDKRAGIQSDLLRELETDGNGNGKAVEPARPKTSSDDDTVLVESGGPAGAQGGKKKKKKQAQQQAMQQPTPPAE